MPTGGDLIKHPAQVEARAHLLGVSDRRLGSVGHCVFPYMIADMRRVVELLDSSVNAEEERTTFRDRTDGRYPILARQFAERRDNLKVTIATLEARLSSDSMNVPSQNR
jgi:hypothetical protein